MAGLEVVAEMLLPLLGTLTSFFLTAVKRLRCKLRQVWVLIILIGCLDFKGK